MPKLLNCSNSSKFCSFIIMLRYFFCISIYFTHARARTYTKSVCITFYVSNNIILSLSIRNLSLADLPIPSFSSSSYATLEYFGRYLSVSQLFSSPETVQDNPEQCQSWRHCSRLYFTYSELENG